MAITNYQLDIMNNALRLVGSYHLDSNDTTSTTYEIADRAFNQAVHEIFSNNVFQYNTRRITPTGPNIVATSTLPEARKPSDKWEYRINLGFAGPSNDLRYVHILDVTSIDGSRRLDWVLDNSTFDDGNIYEDVPYLFTTEDKVHIYYAFVPQSDETSGGGSQGDTAYYMPPHLANLVSYLMASNMAIELSGSEQRADLLYQRYTLALRRARVMEGRSSPAQQYISDSNSSFINAVRRYGEV